MSTGTLPLPRARALNPVCDRGQSLRTFLLQLLGTGAGVIYGLIVLTIFHGVNGYDYNP